MKKNCYNCKYLEEWSDSENEGQDTVGGFFCDRRYQKYELRDPDIEQESNMEREGYRRKGKRCFEPKQEVAADKR